MTWLEVSMHSAAVSSPAVGEQTHLPPPQNCYPVVNVFHPAYGAESERGCAQGWAPVKINNPEVFHLPPGKETTHGRNAL